MLRHLIFGDSSTPKKIALLIPNKDFKAALLTQYYIKPLENLGINSNSIIAFNLNFAANGKAPVATIITPWLEQLKSVVDHLQIHTLLCCDATYFKKLTKVTRSELQHGYATSTIWKNVTAFIAPNFRQIFYKPEAAEKITFCLESFAKHIHGLPSIFSSNILQEINYPNTPQEIQKELDRLKEIPILTCDIETYSLQLAKAGILSIAFGESKHKGSAFFVNVNTRQDLRNFFETYTGKLIYHNGTFDTKVLIWNLFMQHPSDFTGMLHGLDIMFRDYEDTKTLAYLALNSTSGNSLKLKELAFEFTGNYAVENIKDITKELPADILKYNLTDAAATWYLYDKFRNQVRIEQEKVYTELFLPSLKVITQMELVGMPINLGQVLNVEHDLDDIARTHIKIIQQHPIITEVTWLLRDREADKANLKLKKLRKTRNDFLSFEFNPGSSTQLIFLLHNYLKLDIINTTDNNNPSTDGNTLQSHIEHLKQKIPINQSSIELLTSISELTAVSKILNTFIPAFKNNSIVKEGWNYLHGNFNLGGTKSGRLSSSDPNLMNIPSTGTQYAEAIKTCFQAPPTSLLNPNGWLSVGADYKSLEDMISALLTKDPNKLAVYTDGYDGHCLRAYSYFPDRMLDIGQELLKEEEILERVKIINSIVNRYPDLRQLAKGPTFALTYMGTWKTLVKNFGLTINEAKQIEINYHELYQIADAWVMEQLKKAQKTGYVELAFGLKLRTPILPQVILENSATLPPEAHKEMKTAGNALGQSYGLLNSHSANLFMDRVWKSPYRELVLPTAHIHDAQYYLIKNSLSCLKWVNDNLIECMEWNELAPIQHPTVKLGAALEVYYPNWASGIKLPNKATIQQLQTALKPFNA